MALEYPKDAAIAEMGWLVNERAFLAESILARIRSSMGDVP